MSFELQAQKALRFRCNDRNYTTFPSAQIRSAFPNGRYEFYGASRCNKVSIGFVYQTATNTTLILPEIQANASAVFVLHLEKRLAGLL